MCSGKYKQNVRKSERREVNLFQRNNGIHQASDGMLSTINTSTFLHYSQSFSQNERAGGF